MPLSLKKDGPEISGFRKQGCLFFGCGIPIIRLFQKGPQFGQHEALTELSPPGPEAPLHDCSAWRVDLSDALRALIIPIHCETHLQWRPALCVRGFPGIATAILATEAGRGQSQARC